MPDLNRSQLYLAFDLGAESGRAVLAYLDGGLLKMQEIHRFANEPVECGGSFHWDVLRLWLEFRKVLASLDELELSGIGVDAWGVDYALLGESGELLQNPYHYRDSRTAGAMQEVFRKVSKEEIYQATGIQFMPINTLYQLHAAQQFTPQVLKAARKLLTIPDLFHYWLTGNAVCEYSIATTTQMMNPITRTWATELIGRLDLPGHLLGEIVEPGTLIGNLRPEISPNCALARTPVITPAAHDTASAVAAIEARDGTAFISSGTWSLVGTELDSPVISPEALRFNFTNEGGVNRTTRLLKNVMGLWMLQCCRQAWEAQGQRYDHRELIELASREQPLSSIVDPDHESFLHPADMLGAIDNFCDRTSQPCPKSVGGYTRTILESLAFKYRVVLGNLEQLIGRQIRCVRIIGGGSRNRLLNQLTADATGRKVIAGPAEATALGNVAVQILGTGAVGSLKEVRAIIQRSHPGEIYEPLDSDRWNRQAGRFDQYCEAVYA